MSGRVQSKRCSSIGSEMHLKSAAVATVKSVRARVLSWQCAWASFLAGPLSRSVQLLASVKALPEDLLLGLPSPLGVTEILFLISRGRKEPVSCSAASWLPKEARLLSSASGLSDMCWTNDLLVPEVVEGGSFPFLKGCCSDCKGRIALSSLKTF